MSEKDRNKQQKILVDSARKAMDEGRVIEALSLIERIPNFWTGNIITIMITFCTHPTDDEKMWAYALLRKHLKKCSDAAGLVSAALWVDNPKRSRWLPIELKQLIDGRRRYLEPDWNGIWDNQSAKSIPQQYSSNKHICPDEISNSDACLDLANQTSSWKPWIKRYLDLGGSTENPKYLKAMLSRAASKREGLSFKTKKMFHQYSKIEKAAKLRSFLRHITPARKSRKGYDINEDVAKYALLIYCSCERLEHGIDDWIHIAQSSLYLKHVTIQKIAQRGLAGSERTFSAHNLFEKLKAIHGDCAVTSDAKKDVGIKGNPIWDSAYKFLPIDGNAVKILLSYSKYELEVL